MTLKLAIIIYLIIVYTYYLIIRKKETQEIIDTMFSGMNYIKDAFPYVDFPRWFDIAVATVMFVVLLLGMPFVFMKLIYQVIFKRKG